MRAIVGFALTFALATEAYAGDKGACRKARREHTLDGWTKYVMDNPDGACKDEAMGEMVVLVLGRVVNGIVGDPTKVALGLAQVGHMSDDDFAKFRDMMGMLSGLGAGGLGGLGALGGGGGLGGLGALGGGGFGGLGGGGLGSMEESPYGMDQLFGGSGLEGGLAEGEAGMGSIGLLGTMGTDDTIYVGMSVVDTKGGWNSDAFYSVLDEARFGLQDCWKAKALPLSAITYDAAFSLSAGKVATKKLTMGYSADGQPKADVEECIRQELGKLAFPAEYTGDYTYRIEFY